MGTFGVIGDSSQVELPQTQIDEQALNRERNAAKFSRTKEFKALKEYLEGRIVFYQHFLPDGRDIRQTSPDANQWALANAIIGEFKALINYYEQSGDPRRPGEL